MRFKICSHELFVELLCKDGRCLQKKPQKLPIHSLDIYRVNCVLGTGARQRPGEQGSPRYMLMSCGLGRGPIPGGLFSPQWQGGHAAPWRILPAPEDPMTSQILTFATWEWQPTPGMRYHSHQKPQSAGTLSLAYSPPKTSQDGLISNSLTIILKNDIFECAESSKIWASSWTFSYPEAQFPSVSTSQFSVYGLGRHKRSPNQDQQPQPNYGPLRPRSTASSHQKAACLFYLPYRTTATSPTHRQKSHFSLRRPQKRGITPELPKMR